MLAVDNYRTNSEIESSLEELARLAETAGVEVVGSVTQKLPHPLAGSYIGKGKIEEVKTLQASLTYDLILVNDELSPAQQRNLEKAFDVKIVDRTALILDVFARRAQTHEGRLQVELAQLEYRLPRLTGMWSHLSRQGVGGVGLRGPGETQLESDRRELGKRIAFIKRELGEVHRHRELYREHRRQNQIPVVALVGYTNAGKSTLLNSLTGSTVLAEDKLFATLDPTTRRVTLPGGREVLVTDTVGFIKKLPTFLIAAFRATLEEINAATLLVHVVDFTHMGEAHVETVKEILEDLGADDKPVITVLNKIDLGEHCAENSLVELTDTFGLPREVILTSATTGDGLSQLLEAIEEELENLEEFVEVSVTIPYNRAELVDLFHRVGRVVGTNYDERGVTMSGVVPAHRVERFTPYISLAGDARPHDSAHPGDEPQPSNSAA
ncbi:MAG: GTPase HflX [Thermomicrobiales bacterium]